MRWFHIFVIAVLALVTMIFVFQNFSLFFQNVNLVTFIFLGLWLTMPPAWMAIFFYILGIVTGGSLWALVRWAAAGTRRPEA